MQVFHFGVFPPFLRNGRAAPPQARSGATPLGGGARAYRTAPLDILRRTIVTWYPSGEGRLAGLRRLAMLSS